MNTTWGNERMKLRIDTKIVFVFLIASICLSDLACNTVENNHLYKDFENLTALYPETTPGIEDTGCFNQQDLKFDECGFCKADLSKVIALTADDLAAQVTSSPPSDPSADDASATGSSTEGRQATDASDADCPASGPSATTASGADSSSANSQQAAPTRAPSTSTVNRCGKCTITAALDCVGTTRNADADFLRCREDRQLLLASGIATLAAGAGGAVVAGSTVAAVSMGAIAGAGLGLDYATFNASKSQAFANASDQLECIFDNTVAAKAQVNLIVEKYSKFQQEKARLGNCDYDSTAIQSVYAAEDAIGAYQWKYAWRQLSHFGLNVYLGVRNAQNTALSASQFGVVQPSQIAQAVQAMSYSIPTLSGVSQASGPTCDDIELTRMENAAREFRAALAAFHLPDPSFQQCMAINAYSGVSSGSSTSNSKTSTTSGAPSGSTPSGNTPSGNPGGNPGSSQPTNVSPSSAATPSALVVQVQPNTATVNNSSLFPGTALVVSGGVPPYYAKAIDTYPPKPQFAKTGVLVAFPDVRLPLQSTGGRVLVADQAGSQQIVYVTAGASSSGPAPAASAPCCCATVPCAGSTAADGPKAQPSPANSP
jgi:hypothetical protein